MSLFNRRRPGKTISYILDAFPTVSETFVLSEIEALTRSGIRIEIFSLSNPRNKVVHPAAERFLGQTRYVSNLGPGGYEKWIRTSWFFIRHPVKCLKFLNFFKKRSSVKDSFSLVTLYRLAYELRKLRVSHIHAHFASRSTECAMILSWLSGIPYSFTTHAYDIFVSPFLLEEKVRNAKFTVAISEFNRKHILNLIGDRYRSKIRVVHCGVDLGKVGLAPKPRESGKLKIVCVARLVEKKGITYLIEALAKIRDNQQFDFECSIFGDGPEKDRLFSQRDTLSLTDKVHFHESVVHEEVLREMQGSDVLVLPCTKAKNGDQDGIPVALMEAMALGVPVISTPISGIPELIKPGAGILVEPKDSNSLATGIMSVYGLSAQETLEMTARARKIVELDFDLEKETSKLLNLFCGSVCDDE